MREGRAGVVRRVDVDALDLAKQNFVENPNTHDNWDILCPDIQMALTKLAEAAIYEITTGKEIK